MRKLLRDIVLGSLLIGSLIIGCSKSNFKKVKTEVPKHLNYYGGFELKDVKKLGDSIQLVFSKEAKTEKDYSDISSMKAHFARVGEYIGGEFYFKEQKRKYTFIINSAKNLTPATSGYWGGETSLGLNIPLEDLLKDPKNLDKIIEETINKIPIEFNTSII